MTIKRRIPVGARVYLLCLTWFTLLGVTLSGCGKSGPELVPASGKITLNGGSWPSPGIIYCNAVESPPGVPKRPCSGFFDTDGNLTFKTFEDGDGIIPGTYKVGVECWKVKPLDPSGKSAQSYVPIKYQSGMASGFEIKVEPGQSQVDVNFDVVGKTP